VGWGGGGAVWAGFVARTGAAACAGGEVGMGAGAATVRVGADDGALMAAVVDGPPVGDELGVATATEAFPAGEAVSHPVAAMTMINAKSAPTTMSARLKDLGT
jgi:hypothetical protein